MASRKTGRRRAQARQREPRLPSPARTSTQPTWPAWMVGAALLIATLAAYQPAWHGGLLWDDDKHVTSPELQSVHGLKRIWFDLGATQQYYPVTHSTFWVEHRIWGDATLPYHLVNIGLHVLAAVLLLVILRRLGVAGAVLAAALFALHPVQVQSVAWISELKNTLSGVFFLLSVLWYLRFDDGRNARDYVGAFSIFGIALMAKSVTAVLPGVLLVVLWWRRGELDWRRDLVPVIPLFTLGAAAGLFTAWVERTYIGAQGADFRLTVVERCLIAGRAIWFYLGKIVWPAELSFEYPRWSIDQGASLQYVYPTGVLCLLVVCWLLRGRSRAPLSALLMFGGILFPVLGFVNVYPFRFSFVADHFEYLALIPIVTLAAAVVAIASDRWMSTEPAVRTAGGLAIVTVLAVITWNRSYQYTDALTLYRSILEKNPSSWLAHDNLGALLRATAPDAALEHLTEAVRLKPGSDVGHYNLANVFQQTGRFDDAIREYHETLRLSPHMALAHYNLGSTLLQMSRLEDAEAEFNEAIRSDPTLALAHSGLCRTLELLRRPDDARRHCETAIRLQPNLAVLHYDYAGVLRAQDRLDQAIDEYTAALRLRPDSIEAHSDLAGVLQQVGRLDEARQHYEAAIRLSPDFGLPHSGLCGTLLISRRLDEARGECETAVRLQPDLAVAQYDLANVQLQQGQMEGAAAHYLEALRVDPQFPEAHLNLSAALQRLGRNAEARYHVTQATSGLNDAAVHAIRGAALEGQGRTQDARTEYTRALQLEPGLSAAREGLLRIEAVGERR